MKKLDDLRTATREGLEEQLREIYLAIAEVRDTKGDKRCWGDYFKMYRYVPGIPRLKGLPSKEEFMGICEYFIRHCTTDKQHVSWEQAQPENDYHVAGMSDAKLRFEIATWRRRFWRDYLKFIRGRKTVEDDIYLYLKMPQLVVFDLRLPDPASMHANCDRFYECKAEQLRKTGKTDLHSWSV